MSEEKYPSTKVSFPKDKIEKYLLRRGAKHSKEFTDVGYSAEDCEKLFHDIESQFDKSMAVEYECKPGVVEYNIYMKLGGEKKRTFKTTWREDSLAPLPRFITAHRVGGQETCSMSMKP